MVSANKWWNHFYMHMINLYRRNNKKWSYFSFPCQKIDEVDCVENTTGAGSVCDVSALNKPKTYADVVRRNVIVQANPQSCEE